MVGCRLTCLRTIVTGPRGSHGEWTAHCETLARQVVFGYFIPGADQNDVLQEARLGVWEALRDWDPTGGMRFDSFARLCARRQIMVAIKKGKAVKRRALNEAVSIDDLRLVSANSDPCELVLARDEARRLLTGWDRLTPLERESIVRVRVYGDSYGATGPSKKVDNAIQRGLRKLQAAAA